MVRFAFQSEDKSLISLTSRYRSVMGMYCLIALGSACTAPNDLLCCSRTGGRLHSSPRSLVCCDDCFLHYLDVGVLGGAGPLWLNPALVLVNVISDKLRVGRISSSESRGERKFFRSLTA